MRVSADVGVSTSVLLQTITAHSETAALRFLLVKMLD